MTKKKKADPIIEEAIEEVVEEIIEVTNEEPVAEEVADEPVSNDSFIYTQLRIINKMTNTAKAKRLAERVLRNRKGK